MREFQMSTNSMREFQVLHIYDESVILAIPYHSGISWFPFLKWQMTFDIFSRDYLPSAYILGEVFVHIFCLVFNCFVFIKLIKENLLFNFRNSLYIFGYKLFILYMFHKYFLSVYGLFFHSLNSICQKAEVINVCEDQSIFSFMDCTFGVIAKKYFPKPRS